MKSLYVEWWAMYEAVRKLGFSRDQVIFGIGRAIDPSTGREHERALLVHVHAQDKKFLIVVGACPEEAAEAERHINELSRQIASGEVSDVELKRMWHASRIGRDMELFQGLAHALLAKGFTLPKLAN